MKKIVIVFIVIFSVYLLNVNSYSQPVPKRSTELNVDQVLENLLAGSKSGNRGLCSSCTYLMGELCCKKAVVPLMKLLHNAECEEVRILAALSLVKIGDGRGVFAVKRSAKYDKSSRVKRMCGIFYNAFLAGDVPTETSFKKG